MTNYELPGTPSVSQADDDALAELDLQSEFADWDIASDEDWCKLDQTLEEDFCY